MRYRRKAPYRYEFQQPLAAHFHIVKVNTQKVKTSNGEAAILDISPDGAKINTSLRLHPAPGKHIDLILTFQLNDQAFDVRAEIIWEKIKATTYDYGIRFLTDEVIKSKLTEQLKMYARKHKKGD